jgi:hypothetical protein
MQKDSAGDDRRAMIFGRASRMDPTFFVNAFIEVQAINRLKEASTMVEEAEACAMEFNPLFRPKSHVTVCCAECHIPEQKSNKFLACNCSVFKYCSETCQALYLKQHQRNCRVLVRLAGKNRNVEFSNLVMRDEYMCNRSSNLHETPEIRAYIYERVLDEYLYRHEEIKSMGMSTDVGVRVQQDYVLVKMRIPFLLAALGHDDLAITEVAMAMDFYGTAMRIPRTKFDDVIQALVDERGEVFEAWPTCFLLPLFLVKLRLVLVWKPYSAFVLCTPSFPEDVRLCVGEFLIGHEINSATARVYADQKRQLRIIVDLIKQQDDSLDSIIRHYEYVDDDEHVEDLISYLFENDSYGFEDYGIFQALRECFQQPPAMKKMATQFILEEKIIDGEEICWERNT